MKTDFTMRMVFLFSHRWHGFSQIFCCCSNSLLADGWMFLRMENNLCSSDLWEINSSVGEFLSVGPIAQSALK